MDKQLYKKATSLKDDIANTKALIHGLAKTFSDAPDSLYKPEIYWSHVIRSLPLGLKQKLHIEAIRYCNKLEEEFEELQPRIMKQQELMDLLESWGFREVGYMLFELNDKIAKYRVVITTNHVDFTVYASYLGKEFNAFNRIAIETLNMESPEFVIYILKGLLRVAMGRLLNDYAQNSFLKESVFS